MSVIAVVEMQETGSPQWWSVLAGTILLLTAVFGCIENSTVLYVFIRTKRLRSPANTFIAGLSAADLLMAVVACPAAAYSGFAGYWALGDVMCILEGWFVYCFGCASIYLLAALSLDRFFRIVKPSKAHKITQKVAVLAVGACYLCGLLWSVMPLLGLSSYGEEKCAFACGLDWRDPSFGSKTYIAFAFVFCFTIPAGIMVYCYFRTVCNATYSDYASVQPLFNSRPYAGC